MGQCLNMGVLGVCFASSGAQLALETGCCGWEGVLQEMPCPWGWGCVSCLAWETNVVWGKQPRTDVAEDTKGNLLPRCALA